MPVARGPSLDTRRAVVAGVAGVAVALVIGAVILWLGSTGGIEVSLGDDEFEVGDTENLAEQIAEEGVPLGFDSVGQQNRPIWVQHLGDDPETGWLAFEARIPGQPDCLAQWDRDRDLFVNSCDDSQTFPADGTGLAMIAVVVEDGDVIVDLNDVRDQPDAGDGDTSGER